MYNFISSCPSCGGELHISTLQCGSCGLEIKKDFEVSVFDKLSDEQISFLLSFLKNQGNLKSLQTEQGISYPAAKKKLNDLLVAMNLVDNVQPYSVEDIDTSTWKIDPQSSKASDIVKAKLISCNGLATVRTYKGKEYVLRIVDEEKFSCDEILDYEYSVFDVITELLESQGGKAKKGYGRRRLGDPGCEETIVAGAIMKNYFGKTTGESCFDPTFALVAILEWAGIVRNGWGYIELTEEYVRERIQKEG